MSDLLLVAGAPLSPRLSASLRERRRTFVVTDDLDVDVTRLRGAILGAGVAPDRARPLLAAAAERGFPALVLGDTSASVVEVRGDTDQLVLRTVAPSDAAMEDPVAGPVPSGAVFTGAAAALSSRDSEFVPLLIDAASGDTLVACWQRIYASLLRPEVPAVEAPAGPFAAAQGAALLLRWVDLVLGRTDDEMPWGRRGPQPVPAPGLSLNPA